MSGAWETVMSEWPAGYGGNGFQAIHLIHLYTGKFLALNHLHQAIVWDPATGNYTAITGTPLRLFCSGHCQLSDGRILIAGGDFEVTSSGYFDGATAPKKCYIFDPANLSSPWTTIADMNIGRYYPTLTTLPNGKVLISSGEHTWFQNGPLKATRLELHDPIGAPMSTPVYQNAAYLRGQLTYPFTFVTPDNDVYDAGPDGGDHRALNNATQSFPDIQWHYGASDPIWGEGGLSHGSAAMYRPGRIVKCGGSAVEHDDGVVHSAYTDRTVLPGANPQWLPSGDPGGFPMVSGRRNHNLVLLPNGRVLCVGGNLKGGAYNYPEHNPTPQARLKPEIWNPDASGAPTWVEQNAAMTDPRYYHSTALLMADSRVIVAGGELDQPQQSGDPPASPPHTVYSAQIYKPPYLDGAPLRPVIGAGPSSFIAYGPRTIAVAYTPEESECSKACLIRLGATTHGFDSDQRYIHLSAGPTQIGIGTVEFTINLNGAFAPPGYYLFFLLGANGVPCTMARYVRIGP